MPKDDWAKSRVIPEDESWLWSNKEASGMVKRGLEQAKRHEFVDPTAAEKTLLDIDDQFV